MQTTPPRCSARGDPQASPTMRSRTSWRPVSASSRSAIQSARLYSTKASYLLGGTIPTAYLPYLSLSGTSMAAPVVSGTVALMLQANPALTPNAVKAILQYTAQPYAGYDSLTQGTGFLNASGAVQLARYFAAPRRNVLSRFLQVGCSADLGKSTSPQRPCDAWRQRLGDGRDMGRRPDAGRGRTSCGALLDRR